MALRGREDFCYVYCLELGPKSTEYEQMTKRCKRRTISNNTFMDHKAFIV